MVSKVVLTYGGGSPSGGVPEGRRDHYFIGMRGSDVDSLLINDRGVGYRKLFLNGLLELREPRTEID